jgi:DnaJ domain
MHGVSFAFGVSDFRGTRPINLDGSSARSFERHRLRQRALVGADMFRRLATGLYVVGLIVTVLALANGSQTLSASVLVLAGTMGDIRVARTGASKIGAKLGGLRRALRWVVWQTIVLAFVLLDIAGLGFTLVAPVWLAPWMTINVAALVLGAWSWSDDRRLQRESAIARERQAEKVRAAERRNLAEREAQRQQQAEHLRQAEQLREAEGRRRQEEEEREAERQQQAERLRQAEQQLREAERRRRQEEEEREAERQQQAERLRQAEQQLREAERRRRQEEEEREAQRQRKREREQPTTQSQKEWWSVLEVTPSASKDEIVRNYRRKIQQCHPDRVAGLAPEFLRLAEETTKILNVAYEQAIYARRQGAHCP